MIGRENPLLRIRHSVAALCFGLAWLSMVTLITMLTVAELLEVEPAPRLREDARDADMIARLYVVRPRRG